MKRKQLWEIIQSSYIRLSGLSVTGASSVITPQVGAALTAAGLVNQVSTNLDTPGIIASAPSNRVHLKLTNGDFVEDAGGNRVYATLTQNVTDYEIAFFSYDGTTETAYTFAAPTDVDIVVPYRFRFSQFPVDALLLVKEFGAGDTPATGGAVSTVQALTITTQNTIPNLAQTPQAGSVVLFVENIAHTEADGSITVAGQTITWVTAVTGYNIDPADRVVALYNIA